jgi:uncharacterized surface protein with fasciclin (FAS1) repeats
MKVHYLWSLLLALSFTLTFSSCDDDNDDVTPTIVGFAQENDNFSSLVAAVERAGLVDALNDEMASLTLFAPTNAAFAAFLQENNYTSVDDVPVAALQQVLLYHVIAGEVASTALETNYYPTLAEYAAGQPLNLFINTDGGVAINISADVEAADEKVANGIIHTVDEVILPANVVTFAAANPNFSILVQALTRSDLTTNFIEILNGDGPFTVFAPTNEAFINLLNSVPEWNTLNDIPVETLDAVLKYHVVAGANVRAADITDDAPVTTFSDGATFSIDLDGATPTINAGSNTANIIATDVQGTNGVVHAIDAVILP